MTLISFLASLGMAVGPPLVYLDQYASIIRKKDSSGFAMDVCGVLVRNCDVTKLSPKLN
jgi:hypothetical protein